MRVATVPICDACWVAKHWHDPVRMRDAVLEECHYCHRECQSGIYVREHIPDICED